ncbi:MAG TPA: hypothetical protein P5137_13605 [Candidatus Brocadiia bacterium]|nr:hypothetical protein [Candidatus Brocadiia bacterium]
MKNLILSAVAAASMAFTLFACRSTPSAPAAPEPPPKAGPPESYVLAEQLASADPFVVSQARAKLMAMGDDAFPALIAAAMVPRGSDQDPGRLQRNAIGAIFAMASDAPPERVAKVAETLVALASSADAPFAGMAAQSLSHFDREYILDLLAQRVLGADEAQRKRARALMFIIDRKGSVEFMLGLLTGERKAPWYTGSQAQATLAENCLQRWTFQDFGYSPAISSDAQRQAILRWRDWWTKNSKRFDRPFTLEDYLPLMYELEANRRTGQTK